MKKFLVVLAVLALTIVSSAAMAEVTVSGSIDIRNLAQNNVNTVPDDGDRNRTTQERLRINVDAKHENVKGRITIENDWDVWGRVEAPQGTVTSPTDGTVSGRLDIREAWIEFTVPGLGPTFVKVGHQFLALGNAWFFRSNKYGSDAWVIGVPGKNTVAFVDVKAAEGQNGKHDDIDAYVLLDVFKINDDHTAGIYLVQIQSPMGLLFDTFSPGATKATLNNIGLHYTGKLGMVTLKAEIDAQSGKIENPAGDTKFKGNQIILEASAKPTEELGVNLTLASGTGNKAGSTDNKGIVTLLDNDPHYTFIYEYFSKTACNGVKLQASHTGFCNTQAIGLGASYEVLKNFGVDLSAWMLKANEKVSLNGAAPSDKLGNEVDLRLRWKIYDQLTWSVTMGRLMVGDAYKDAAGKSQDADAVQGILSYKF